MTRIRYTMSARSQGNAFTQRQQARLVEKDIHRWLVQRLDGFYCDLQVMYMPHVIGPTLARTHIVLNNTPPRLEPPRRREGPDESNGAEPAPVPVRVAVLLRRRGWHRRHGRELGVA